MQASTADGTDDGDNLDTDGVKGRSSDREREAFDYAWEYFKYHAAQRQNVFRFYLIVIAAIFAGYWSISTASSNHGGNDWLFGIPIVVFSLLFWQLDRRSHKIIRIAEEYLAVFEVKLAEAVGTDSIRLTVAAHKSKDTDLIRSRFNSFSKVFSWIFVLILAVGTVITVMPLLRTLGKVLVLCPLKST